MPKPICVVVLGLPRSGTTLISTAIGSHEDVCMLDEDFFMSVRRISGGKTPAVKLCIPNHIQMNRKWRTWWGIIRINGFLRKRLHYLLPRSYYSLNDYISTYDVRIICILREPLKTLSAMDNRGHTKLRKALRAANVAYDMYDELLDRIPEQVAFISFDRFLTSPEEQNRMICSFIDHDFDEKMLEAPAKNTRYPGQSFDKSKIGTEDYDTESLDPGILKIVERYKKLISLSF
ncbi:MAG: sulfotransferase [Sneathiella sp.]